MKCTPADVGQYYWITHSNLAVPLIYMRAHSTEVLQINGNLYTTDFPVFDPSYYLKKVSNSFKTKQMC